MKKSILGLFVCVSLGFSAELPPYLKDLAKRGINSLGYKCDVVTSAFQKWDGDIQVVCDDYNAIFIIYKKGGTWQIKVEK